MKNSFAALASDSDEDIPELDREGEMLPCGFTWADEPEEQTI